ncbi:MAG: preprotein translocase subunit SecG [Gammaproteobacteria bacterium]|nr:preprotein translocase subunit SecG [Gammaproteobacteria bacterium]MBU1722799.1 preprotein translocase subunit SecG [Gammaproteobacteria bacterium]MBU2005174.1 preprotein translocase subunit SecG [Gammaproteobacteria bacterium]
MLYNVLLIIQIVISVGIIVLVLMQQGKGADAGAAFGSGASGTVFGSRGSANFLSRTTAILATVFFLNSIALAFLASGRTINDVGSIMGGSAVQTESQAETAPAAPVGDVPPVPGSDAVKSDVPPAPAGTDGASDVPPAPASEEKAAPAGEDKPASDEKTVQENK